MISKRSFRRKVSEEKEAVYKEIRKGFDKFTTICQNVTTDLDKNKENKTYSIENIHNDKSMTNLMCLIYEMTKTTTNEFSKNHSNEVQLLNVNEEKTLIISSCNNFHLNDENLMHNDNICNLLDYLQNLNDETSESDDDPDENVYEDDRKVQFVNDIRNLFVKYIHIITHEFIDELLPMLIKETGAPFPKCARTLLKTPRNIETSPMASGTYCHYGLESALKTFIIMYLYKKVNVNYIDLIVHIDGAPLATSSEKGLRIVACSETVLKLVEVIAIYRGEDKPDANEFLKKFHEEVLKFIKNGIEHACKNYSVNFKILVCDGPAKAYILYVKSHSGYYCCTKCNIKGKYINGVHFPGGIGTLRTDENVKNREYNDTLGDDYQRHGETILNDIPGFGLVTNVVLDYMHLICLGVMLKLIELRTKTVLSDSDIQKISQRLIHLKTYVPRDFSRNPRHFRKVQRLWKATELRQFLLYTGPVVLLGILPQHLYTHFLYLHIAISILVNPILCKNEYYLNYADALLKDFVNNFQVNYKERNMTFNVHNLLHIDSDVRNFGSLDEFSAYRFENHIGKIKQLVRTGNHALVQIGKRIAEIKASNAYYVEENVTFDLSHYRPMQKIQVFENESMRIDCHNNGNNCILLNNGTYIECDYFMKDECNNLQVIGKAFKMLESFYKDELNVMSQRLHVMVAKRYSKSVSVYSVKSIKAKVCKFPVNDGFVLIPLIHTYEQN